MSRSGLMMGNSGTGFADVAIRIPASTLFGGAVTIALFWALAVLVGRMPDIIRAVPGPEHTFTRLLKDTPVDVVRPVKPVLETPLPTPAPRGFGDADSPVIKPVLTVEPRFDRSAFGPKRRMAADTDAIRMAGVQPVYPARAQTLGIEGWALVRFTVDPTGAVKDAVVVDAEPKGVFEDAALKAVARWRYNPKIENGVPVERVGVQTRLEFKLDDNGR